MLHFCNHHVATYHTSVNYKSKCMANTIFDGIMTPRVTKFQWSLHTGLLGNVCSNWVASSEVTGSYLAVILPSPKHSVWLCISPLFLKHCSIGQSKIRLLPDLKPSQSIHSLNCADFMKNDGPFFFFFFFFARGQNVLYNAYVFKAIAPFVTSISTDLHVKCFFYKKWNKKDSNFLFSLEISTWYLGSK